MKRPENYIGVDVSAETFAIAQFTTPEQDKPTEEYDNTSEGFDQMLKWFYHQNINPENSVICVENAGVYCESLCYFLNHHGYSVALEDSKKAKRSFHNLGKTDRIDAGQIGEYAFRFFDELKIWVPRSELVTQVQTLLTVREQLTQQLTASKNIKHAFNKKVTLNLKADEIIEQTIDHLKIQIHQIDQEIKQLITKDPSHQIMVTCLMSIPSVALLMTAQIFVLTEGFQNIPKANSLAAHLGIAPFQHESGSSIYKKPASRHAGPPVMRKLLYLAALSLRTHQFKFKQYFLRKVAEGKSKKLVLNNIANKLIKIICAVMTTKQEYFKNHQSINPKLLQS